MGITELIWSVMIVVIACAILYFVIKAAVKQAFLEMREEERKTEKAEQNEREG